jgi:PAS domain-containing protein
MTRAPSLAPTAAEQRRHMIRFEAAVRNISEGLCMFDAESKLVICNERYASIYGLPS